MYEERGNGRDLDLIILYLICAFHILREVGEERKVSVQESLAFY